MSMDLFGKQSRQELEQLREKHRAISAELRESKALVVSINAAEKSKSQHQSAKLGHDQKVDEYCKLCQEIAAKEAELLPAHEKIKTSLTKEMRELEEKNSAIKAELSDFQDQANALEKEISNKKTKQNLISVEIQKLKEKRSKTEISYKEVRGKQSELSCAVDKLTRQQEALASSNLYMKQVVTRLNRHGDEDTVFASLEHDLYCFLNNDRTSGAMQVTLEARPLLLAVDFGYDSLNFAAVRAGQMSEGSEISLCLESRKIEQGMGCSRFEVLLAGWVWERFSAIHPRMKESAKEQKGVELCLPVSQRLLSLLCQGAPQGEVEETIVIDSEPFSASILLLREELVSVLLPLLGPDGELTGAIRRFLAEFKLSVDAIDRIVCMGCYGRLPLVGAALADLFKQPVLVPDFLPTLTLAEQKSAKPVTVDSSNGKRASVIIMSDPQRTKKEREGRLRYEKELAARLTRERIEQEERERREQAEQERLARKEQERQEREKQEKEKLERQIRDRKEKEEREREEKIRYEKEKLERQKRDVEEHKESVKRKKESPPAYFTCSISGIEFVLVKGGTFQMGDFFGSDSVIDKPAHTVTVSDYLIGKYPVTQEEWKRIMGNTIDSYYKKDNRYPIESMEFDDIQEFIKKLNLQSRMKFRLPTEAEWEYAARSGGKKERYSGGGNIDSVAWYYKKGDGSTGKTHPVGLKQPNGLGIFDMSGNVVEWVNDWYDRYSVATQHDPQGPPDTHFGHVTRGSPYGPETTNRGYQGKSNGNQGFRLALSPFR